ncbi:hypothetical protein POM88_048466 [Heracleum sosnowskyi]|uniref:Uncharacterized protein n=1 Tax=Heracleum sosnowskyi TaxID=360622 RepID=A0AAD8GWB0_9APIA|nr:hypothetical protein POM88_048466 [Heracleum sosnowskyi]
MLRFQLKPFSKIAKEKALRIEESDFASKGVVKHSMYSEHVGIHDYVPLLHSISSDLFDEGPNDIRHFLKDNGNITGKYYDAKDFAKILMWYFKGRDVYITFKRHPLDNYIYQNEIELLPRTRGVLTDHPMVPLIPSEKFMLHHI